VRRDAAGHPSTQAENVLNELLRGFIAETNESLSRLESDLTDLRKTPLDEGLVGSIFRVFHNLKGNAGLCALPRLEALAHAAETLLDAVRDHRVNADEPVIRALLAAADAAKNQVDHIAVSGRELEADHTDLKRVLVDLASGAMPESNPRSAERADTTDPSLWVGLEGSVRIDVPLLDGLLERAQRLSTAAAQLTRHAATIGKDPSLNRLSTTIGALSDEIEELTLRARLQPIGTVFDKYPRLARRLQASADRSLELRIQGRDVQIDRTILEAITDPITQLVRNAVVHGIETAESRMQAGKRPTGRLDLRAHAEDRYVHIEISDDGAGIDPARVRAKAVEMGLIGADEAQRLSHADTMRLIFAPGFSLSAEVTRLSGRGVGLDVVKTNLESVGATIQVESRVGRGTTFTLRIPATLSYPLSLVFSWGGNRYAVPEERLLEIIAVAPQARAERYETVRGIRTYRLRDSRLPLVLPPSHDDTEHTWEFIIALQGDDAPFGVVAESIHGSEKLTVRPLPDTRAARTGILGTASRGNREMTWVLDPVGLSAGLNSAFKRQATRKPALRAARVKSPSPREPAGRASQGARRGPTPPTPVTRPRRALIVDDTASMRRLMRRMLAELGFEIEEALNGREALERLSSHEGIELIMVDWNMPEMNGIDFIRSVRANPRYNPITIMMVSTEADQRKVTRALEAGADDYIRKPFTPTVIAKKLGLIGWIAQ